MSAITAIVLLAACGSDRHAQSEDSVACGNLFDHEQPEILLSCDKFSQPIYWLGEGFAIRGLPEVRLGTSYTQYDEEPITWRTQVFLGYESDMRNGFALNEWYRPAWDEYVAPFAGYDPATVPEEGPINWWQHPCVEEETYHAENGAVVHIFRAHLDSLIFVPPMSPGEVATGRSQPAGIVNAHVYFENTVIQLDVAVEPGDPYDSEETVRHIAESLRPYDED